MPILKNISFCVESRQVLAVLGPNGVGKTTLLRSMMGMLPWTSGGSFLDGENIRDMTPGRLWREMAYVPQAKSFPFAFTVEEMILLGRSSRIGTFGTPEKADRERCERAMEELGIAHMRRKLCNQISGGELQMVLIARALCAEPKLLVLDEPESNLDFRNRLSSFLKRFAAFPAKRDCAASSTRIIPATRCASPTGRSSSHARVRQTSASHRRSSRARSWGACSRSTSISSMRSTTAWTIRLSRPFPVQYVSIFGPKDLKYKFFQEESMKRILSLFLAALMVLSLATCGAEPAAPRQVKNRP